MKSMFVKMLYICKLVSRKFLYVIAIPKRLLSFLMCTLSANRVRTSPYCFSYSLFFQIDFNHRQEDLRWRIMYFAYSYALRYNVLY